ncbi:MAG: chorismate-binding protein, partial [Rhodanobacteraceae bacterium]
LLESAARGTNERWDILFGFPQGALTLHPDGRVRDADGTDRGERFLDALDQAWKSNRRQLAVRGARPSGKLRHSPRVPDTWHPGIAQTQELPPFTGGWLLYLGYELAEEIEPSLRLPRDPRANAPVALALRCPAAILADRECGRTVMVVEDEDRADMLDAMQRDIEHCPGVATSAPPRPREIVEDDPAHFLAGLERIHQYLRGGDTFQVNLSRQWRAHYDEPQEPARIYGSLRRANPAPFAGLLQCDGWAIASSSPERLLEIRNGVAQTRPIAGTRPRTPGDDDAARIRELLAHAKERAEHVMLIDLERNDLGRICIPGTIEVDELMTVESYAHVHHIV